MRTVIRVTSAEDLLAYIPYRLGFRPRDSVVLLGLRGPRGTVGLTSRVDLADIGHPQAGATVVQDMATLMVQDGCDDVLVVLYSDLPHAELGRDPTVRTALDHLRRSTTWADAPGPWVVGRESYGSWGTGADCAPPTTPLTELGHRQLAAAMVFHGHSVANGREELGVPRSGDASRRRAALRAARDAHRLRADALRQYEEAHRGASFGVQPDPSGLERLLDWREGERRRWERLVVLSRRGDALPAAELGRMAVAMSDPSVRDGVLCFLVLELPPAVPSPAVVIQVLERTMQPGGWPPELERTEPAAVVLRAMAATCSRRTGAWAVALLAWLAWWSGDGARADVLAQQALAARPGTPLAEVVDQALQARVPPGWVMGEDDDGSPCKVDAIG